MKLIYSLNSDHRIFDLNLYFRTKRVFFSATAMFIVYATAEIDNSARKTPKMAIFGQIQKIELLQSFYYSRLRREAFVGRFNF